jgi:hypothetical protein
LAGKRGRGKRADNRGETFAAPLVPLDDNSTTPKFCLAHLVSGYNLDPLDKSAQAAFAIALQKRSSLTWGEIMRVDRHGLGYEFLSADKFKCAPPHRFEGTEKFMVFRYCGILPMAGVRIRDTFHVLWIERQFGELYDHGS